jgi:phosphatidylserine decarboxylase
MQGPWTVYVIGALPLNAISRAWGWANNLTLPVWFRPFGFKLYAYIFGCNLDEMKDPDLTHYKSLGEFFYRELAPGMRTIDEEAAIVSPADGTVLHFGTIKGRQVEQVKGITYSLDALLGLSSSPEGIEEVRGPGSDLDDKEFAAINGIDYSLDRLLGDEKLKKMGKRFISWRWWKSWVVSPKKANKTGIPAASQPDHADKTAAKPDPDDADDEPVEAGVETPDTPEILSRYASVAYEMGSGALPPILQRHSPGQDGVADGNKLHFAVVYLAPGDYHRFHSPTNWVVERRRHFRGELYSVSPYIANRLSNLFILNERVALLGRWRYGFFSMIPVGATNVGSIKVNFDADLRTNVREQRPLAGTFSEASYGKASRLLGGQPLSKGEEMGGFLLGSTIVLVWESPDFAFEIEPGQKVKVGQRLGDLGFKQVSEEERRRHQTKKRWWFF